MLAGAGGDDRIEGLGGNDQLSGGEGDDIFVFSLPTDGVDTIADFTSGADVLEISASGFDGGLVAGGGVTLVTAADAASASSSGSDGYFIFDDTGPDQSTVYWDPTGGSGADAIAIATLTGVTTLLPYDFQLV